MDQSNDLDELSALVAAIYDSAIDPNLWPRALAAMCEAMHFKSAALNLRTFPAGDIVLLYTTGIEPHWLDMMYSYGAEALEQWGGIAKMMTFDPQRACADVRQAPGGADGSEPHLCRVDSAAWHYRRHGLWPRP